MKHIHCHTHWNHITKGDDRLWTCSDNFCKTLLLIVNWHWTCRCFNRTYKPSVPLTANLNFYSFPSGSWQWIHNSKYCRPLISICFFFLPPVGIFRKILYINKMCRNAFCWLFFPLKFFSFFINKMFVLIITSLNKL